MKKLNKNTNAHSFSVESMATLATCNCNACTSGYCQCTTISDYAGYYYIPNGGVAYASHATGQNVLTNG